MSGARYFNGGTPGTPKKTAGDRFRQVHRAVAVLFTVTVAANFAFMTQGQPPGWVTYSPLLPLLFLFLTGVYLFVRPYLGGRKGT